MSKKSSVQIYKKSEDQSYSPAARQYHLRRESGLCVKCGGQLDERSKLLCTTHLDYYNNWHASKRAKIAAALELLKQQEVAQTTAPEVVQTEVVKTKSRKSSKQAK